TAMLKWGETYTVTATRGILAALDGAPLDQIYTWQFTVSTVATPFGIDVGSGPYDWAMAADGGLMRPDKARFSSGGTVSTTTATIGGTSDPFLYSNERDGVFTYTLNVPNGAYDVKLMFADTTSTGPGQRVFSVDIADTTANPDIQNLDIYSKVGKNTAYVQTIQTVQATPGPLRSHATIALSTIPT